VGVKLASGQRIEHQGQHILELTFVYGALTLSGMLEQRWKKGAMNKP
jgi:hypothetical protein